MSIRRIFGWRLWFVTALFLIAIAVIWDVARQAADDSASHHQNAVQTDQNARLIKLLQVQSDEFTHDRDALLTDQSLLLTYTRNLADREEALLTYLRDHGIRLPERLVTTFAPPVLIKVPAQSTRPSARSAPFHKGKGHKK